MKNVSFILRKNQMDFLARPTEDDLSHVTPLCWLLSLTSLHRWRHRGTRISREAPKEAPLVSCESQGAKLALLPRA